MTAIAGIGDANNRPIQRIIGKASAFDEGLSQKKREVLIAVTDQPLAKARFRFTTHNGCRCVEKVTISRFAARAAGTALGNTLIKFEPVEAWQSG